MWTERVDEELLQRYLLGCLSEQAQIEVEDRAFANRRYMEALEAAEADLIDSYVRGELAENERRQFEHRFLISAQRRRKVEFAKALAQVATEAASEQPHMPRLSAWEAVLKLFRGSSGMLRLGAAAAAFILIATASWLAVQNATLRSRLTRLEARHNDIETREQALRTELREQQARIASRGAESQPREESQPQPTQFVASLVFAPGLSRGGSHQEQLTLESTTQLARLEIQLEPRDEFPLFRVELLTRSGAEILSRVNLTRSHTTAGSSVFFDVPASAIPAGEYELTLKGLADGQQTEIGYYYFRVQKR